MAEVYLVARRTAALTALATAYTANSNAAVSEQQFAAVMWPASIGAGLGEALGYKVMARNLLQVLFASDDVVRTTVRGRTHYSVAP